MFVLVLDYEQTPGGRYVTAFGTFHDLDELLQFEAKFIEKDKGTPHEIKLNESHHLRVIDPKVYAEKYFVKNPNKVS